MNDDRHDTPVMDHTAFMKRVGGSRHFAGRVATYYQDHFRHYLTQISAALSADNAPDVAYAAHAYKGIVGEYCAAPILRCAQTLEEAARRNDLPEVKERFVQLETASLQLSNELADYAASWQHESND